MTWRPALGRHLLVVVAAVTGMSVLAGCGSPQHVSGRPAKDQDVVLSVRSVPKLGDVVVTHGWTLYMYPPDRRRKVTCTRVGACRTAWPPLFVTAGHRVVAGPGIRADLIGSTPGDGGRVVTYNHWPLYYYIGDQKVDQINGQGQGFNWYVISPDGIPNRKPLAASIE